MMSIEMWRRAWAGAKLATAGAVVAGVMAFSAPAQAAFIVEDNVSQDPFENLLFIGFEGGVNIIRNAGESAADPLNSGGSLLYKFEATQDLVAIETNTTNPVTAFLNPLIEWLDSDGTTVLKSLDASVLNSNNQPTSMSILMALNDIRYLRLSWEEITERGNWDVDISAVPLPPALLLFLSGLAGIGFLGRVKSKRRQRDLAAA